MNELLKMFASDSAKGKGRVANRGALLGLVLFVAWQQNQMRADMRENRCRCRDMGGVTVHERTVGAGSHTNTIQHSFARSVTAFAP